MTSLAVTEANGTVRRARGRPTVRESEALHASVVAAAIREFETHGFELANVNTISTAAGTTKATVYRLFGSKEQLFKVAIRAALERAGPTKWTFDCTLDPQEMLYNAAKAISNSYLTGSVGALWHSVLAVKKRFPEFHDEILTLMRKESIASSLASCLANLHRRGVLNVPDPLMTAHHFSLLVGQGRELALPPKATARQEEERVAQIVTMFVQGHTPLREGRARPFPAAPA